MRGYDIQRIYVVICKRCNEEINRSDTGIEPTTYSEALDSAREHEKVYHPI